MDYDLREWDWYADDPSDFLIPTKLISACVVGASVICVDLIIRRIPGKRNFRIQDSNAFLSSSLSLSFGVMVSYRQTCP